jgi:hypothetical protein
VNTPEPRICFSPPGAGDDGDLSQPKTRIKSDFSEVSRSIYAPITFYTWNLTDSVALLAAGRPARTRRARASPRTPPDCRHARPAAAELGWNPTVTFEQQLLDMIRNLI